MKRAIWMGVACCVMAAAPASLEIAEGSLEARVRQLERTVIQLHARVAELEQQIFPEAVSEPPGSTEAGGAAVEASVVDPEDDGFSMGEASLGADRDLGQSLYDSAYRLLQERQYQAAFAGFQQVLTQAPRAACAPLAHYWIGELHLIAGRYDAASAAFETVLSQYPEDPKAADSALKLGVVAELQGDSARALDYFEAVCARFKDTPASVQAAAKIARLQQTAADHA